MRDLAFDLANTVVGGSDALATPRGLASWLEDRAAVLGPVEQELVLRAGDFRSLRDAVRGALEAVSEARPVPPEAARRLNEASAAAPTWPILDLTDPAGPATATIALGGSRTAEILSVLARAAIDVVGAPDGAQVRRCPAPGCGRLFSASRPGRWWCSTACGNRARVARYRRRPSPEPS